MTQKAIDAISLAFHTEPKVIFFISESDQVNRYLDYFVKSELERHTNNDFLLIKKVNNGYTLYNGTQIRILKPEQTRGLRCDVIFHYELSDASINMVSDRLDSKTGIMHQG